jgi:argininosuccinate lyase
MANPRAWPWLPHPGVSPLSDEEVVRQGEKAGMGRLRADPHPQLIHLLYDPQFERDRQEVLPWLLRIDAAHVLMLEERGILPRDTAAGLLRANQELTVRVRAGERVVEPPPVHRGLYMVYERHYVDRLGPEAGGAAHVARSRNDLNATVARMRLRDELLALLQAGGELAGAVLALARDHAGTAMSGFTHFQPAQPTTLGHYLAGVTSELLRELELLAGSFANVNRSPLGAGAGTGTSFTIDRERTAYLLGFDTVVSNSLDAVASRDYAVQVLAALSSLGITLTRLALDLQTWSSQAYGFLHWPDHLVSTSSMMPQKRNVFVLENIRGQATAPTGALVAMLLGLKNTPFSNGVEAGSEAVAHLWPALAAGRTAVQLTELVLREVEVDSHRMRRFLECGETTMTALADHLVAQHGLPFRTAHEAVGSFLQRATEGELRSTAAVRTGLQEALREVAGCAIDLDESEIARSLDPLVCIQVARYGGGPAPESVRAQLMSLDEARQGLTARRTAWRQRLDQAEARLDEAVSALLGA